MLLLPLLFFLVSRSGRHEKPHAVKMPPGINGFPRSASYPLPVSK